jgi:hypothetical protein
MAPHDRDHIAFDSHDNAIRELRRAGINVILCMGYSPRWARPAGADEFFGPDDDQRIADYAAFCAAVAQRYTDVPGMDVGAYEIWNEPNNPNFFKPKPDLDHYARMLKAAYAAIKHVAPKATVISGGLAPEPDNGVAISPSQFVFGIYERGCGPSLDGVGAHPYVSAATDVDGHEFWNAWWQMIGTTGTHPGMRDTMTKHGDGAKLIWATEYGAPSTGKGASEAEQAAVVTACYDRWCTYPWAGPLCWYNLRDRVAADVETSQKSLHRGLLYVDWSEKPAFGAYQRAVAAH